MISNRCAAETGNSLRVGFILVLALLGLLAMQARAQNTLTSTITSMVDNSTPVRTRVTFYQHSQRQ